MRSINLYFQVHQPFRLRTYRFFDIGKNQYYFDEYYNRTIMHRVAEKSYLPMNELLMELIKEYGAQFKLNLSFSGIALEQMELYAPEVLKSFQKLIATGQVEVLGETYAHSLSSLTNEKEFEQQVKEHTKKIQQLFGITPTSFRNTELIYSDEIGAKVADMGFNVMLTEGAKHVLGWKSPNYIYANAIQPKLKVLLRNFRLSDDISFRFSQQSWSEWPLTTDKFAEWLNEIDPKEEVVNLFMDYETFGERQWSNSGIFEFMKALPHAVFSKTDFKFATTSELAQQLQPVSAIHAPYPISWADEERDITAWTGNNMQDEALERLYELAEKMHDIKDEELIRDWNYLQSSNHFYYMCTKWFSDGGMHSHFNHYPSPYEAYINYMNVLADFSIRVNDYQHRLREISEELIEKGKKIGKDIGKAVQDGIKKSEKKIQPVFDDLKNMSNTNIKKLVKEFEAEDLMIALKDAGEELRDKVIPNLSKKTLKAVEEAGAKAEKVTKQQVKKVRKAFEEKMHQLFG